MELKFRLISNSNYAVVVYVFFSVLCYATALESEVFNNKNVGVGNVPANKHNLDIDNYRNEAKIKPMAMNYKQEDLNPDLKPINPEHAGAALDTGKVKKQSKKTIRIGETKECSEDVHRFCSEKAEENNFMILDCLQNNEKTHNKVSDACQNFLWGYKKSLTLNDAFDRASNRDCGAELAKFTDCRALEVGKGLRIPCLIEHFEDVESKNCQKFLNKMGSIIFSDYRYLNTFMTHCNDDIMKLQCGRVALEADDDSPHSQGQTVACLNKKRKEVSSKSCRHALRRVNELQSEDFHFDRPLYYACKDDREEFCHDVKAGDGAVYNCLAKNIAEKRMSTQCREQLEMRQQEIAEDVKVDKMFYDSCKIDIQQHKCSHPDADTEGAAIEEDLSRSTILLCLENAQTDGKKVQPQCLKQMFQLRSILMKDYKVSPEIVSACKSEIDELCDGLEVGGNTINCLMEQIVKEKNKEVGNQCKAEVSKLLQVAKPGEDIRLDRPLQQACGTVVTSACSDIEPGEGNVITCLLENLDHEEMTDDCEEHLLQIQYFAVRDFKLDHQLYTNCKQDAKNLCNTNDFEKPRNMAPESGPLVFACLHRHFRSEDPNNGKLSKSCGHHVQRVLRERSMRIKLMPEVEAACMTDLSDMCSEDDEHKEVGAEMACLQKNLEDLSDKCHEVVSTFTEEQGENVELDRRLMKACSPMISKFCEDKLGKNAMPEDVLTCLIDFKNSFGMDPKCAAGIEHRQLISLKDFRFSHKFRKNCEEAITKLCKSKKTKYEVVACLSEHVRDDTILEHEHRVSRQCRKELRFELLQRGESINLDPTLKKNCELDVKTFCKNIIPGEGAVLECLKEHKKKLTPQCHNLVFKRQQDANMNGDYVLLHKCKRMIKHYCKMDGDEAELMDCLKAHKNEDDFDEGCRKILLRRVVEQTHDFRLNPHLQKACRPDISKYCAEVYDAKHPSEKELEGKVINCLKHAYSMKKKSLSKDCEYEIKSRIKEASMDINQNPIVVKLCKKDIRHFCLDKISNVQKMEIDDDNNIETFGTGTVVECLKKNLGNLRDMKCKEEVSFLVAESRVDINVDPMLHSACQQDLISLCRLVNQGQGKQMSCLLAHLDSDPDALTQGCRGMLSRRKSLWEYAAEVAPPENFGEFAAQINASPARNYFLAVMFTAVGIIFIVGITCGRVTKRVRAEAKNR